MVILRSQTIVTPAAIGRFERLSKIIQQKGARIRLFVVCIIRFNFGRSLLLDLAYFINESFEFHRIARLEEQQTFTGLSIASRSGPSPDNILRRFWGDHNGPQTAHLIC